MKPKRHEVWCNDVWIAIYRLHTVRGENGAPQWRGDVQIEFALGFVVIATWVGDEGDTTGSLVDWCCEDEATFDEAVRREEEFSRAISSALHIEDRSVPVIATQADVERYADLCWAI